MWIGCYRDQQIPGSGTNHVSIAFIAVLLIVAVIITKGRDAIFQKTGQFKITTETRSADSDDVNSVFLRCPAIQAAIKGLDQNKLSIPSTSSTRLASANSSTLLSGAFMKKAAVSAESSFISTGRADPRRIALRRSRREEIWLLCVAINTCVCRSVAAD